MSEFKPENEIIPDPRDRHPGRSRHHSATGQEPKINLDELDLDITQSEAGNTHHAPEHITERYQPASSSGSAPFSRKHMIMGIGILALLLLILSMALTTPKPEKTATDGSASGSKNIDLSALSDHQVTTDTATDTSSVAAQPDQHTDTLPSVPQPRDLSPPAIASVPIQNTPQENTTAGKTRLTLQGNLNNALTEQQDQPAPLPTEPATLAPSASHNQHTASTQTSRVRQESGLHQVVVPKSKTVPPARSHADHTANNKTLTHNQKAKAASNPVSEGKVLSPNILKSAPATHYTLQLNSSSNRNNLDTWAKKSHVTNYTIYQTSRNNQPWYVLVSGLYPSKEAAKQAKIALPASVQAQKPWIKPLRLVQDDIKRK